MIEITLSEIVLFIWAILATGAWLKKKEESKAAKFFVRALLEDEELRETVVSDYKRRAHDNS